MKNIEIMKKKLSGIQKHKQKLEKEKRKLAKIRYSRPTYSSQDTQILQLEQKTRKR